MTTDTTPRTCVHCSRLLPPGSRSYRRFCSSACRWRHWHATNREYPPEETDAERPLFGRKGPRRHFHQTPDGLHYLVGHIDNPGWFDPSGCPPECPGLRDGESYEPAWVDRLRPGEEAAWIAAGSPRPWFGWPPSDNNIGSGAA